MLSLKLKSKKVVYYLISLCLSIALVSSAHGGYLLIKAQLAQYLLNKAWQQQIVMGNFKNINGIKPWPWADIYPVAKLSFERFNLTQIVLNNDSGQALAFGPGLNPMNATGINTTAIVISAHNDTHFSILSELQLGDRVTLTLKSGRSHTFKVSKRTIMDTKIEQLVLATFDNKEEDVQERKYDHSMQSKSLIKELVLVTCYPFASVSNATTLRYVVHFDLLSS